MKLDGNVMTDKTLYTSYTTPLLVTEPRIYIIYVYCIYIDVMAQ